MKQSVGYVAVVVRDYDEAIKFYVDTLGFDLVEDTYIKAQDKRWVLVAPPGSPETKVLLARAVGSAQSSRIGDQTGGRVFLFLHTDDFWRDFKCVQKQGRRLCARAFRGELWHRGGVQRSLWQSLGPAATQGLNVPEMKRTPNAPNGRQVKTVRSACYAVGLHRLRRTP